MRRIPIVALPLALLLAGAAQGAETIKANAVRVGQGTGVQATYLTVKLDRYSTDEERGQWRAAFAAGGQEALVAKWQEENAKVGVCSFTGTTGYIVRAAISVPREGGGRKIYVATDRPIAGFEVMRGARTQDYPIGWIEVEVGADGKGEGQLIAMAELVVQDDRLRMNTYNTEPVKLINVVVREKE